MSTAEELFEDDMKRVCCNDFRVYAESFYFVGHDKKKICSE